MELMYGLKLQTVLTLDLPGVDCSRLLKTHSASAGDSSRQAPTTHPATPFLSSLRRPTLYQPHFGTNSSEQTGRQSWKVAWSYVLNFLSYSRSKLINFSVDFYGIFQRSSNLNTYRNEAFKDIFSCSSQSL